MMQAAATATTRHFSFARLYREPFASKHTALLTQQLCCLNNGYCSLTQPQPQPLNLHHRRAKRKKNNNYSNLRTTISRRLLATSSSTSASADDGATKQQRQSKSSNKNTQLPPRRTIDESEIEENFLKGSGPGGQKINKTASAVQLIHSPTNTVVKCQATRSRSQNRKLARRMLAEKLDFAEKGDESRTAIKAERAHKKKLSADKKKRRKYRALDVSKADNDTATGPAVSIKDQKGEEKEVPRSH